MFFKFNTQNNVNVLSLIKNKPMIFFLMASSMLFLQPLLMVMSQINKDTLDIDTNSDLQIYPDGETVKIKLKHIEDGTISDPNTRLYEVFFSCKNNINKYRILVNGDGLFSPVFHSVCEKEDTCQVAIEHLYLYLYNHTPDNYPILKDVIFAITQAALAERSKTFKIEDDYSLKQVFLLAEYYLEKYIPVELSKEALKNICASNYQKNKLTPNI